MVSNVRNLLVTSAISKPNFESMETLEQTKKNNVFRLAGLLRMTCKWDETGWQLQESAEGQQEIILFSSKQEYFAV